MNNFTLEDARAADRPELLDFLHDAFKGDNPNHLRFEALYPDMLQPTDAGMAPHRITRHEGKICACVGWYPMKVRVGECVVDVYGIGQVSCAPALRGGGRMTALLNDVCEKMEKSGAGLSWLGGRRDRYAHFGWDVAGSNAATGMSAKSAGEPAAGWNVEQVEASHIARFWPLINRAAVSEEVSPETWIARLSRCGKRHRVFVASRGKDVEAVCVAQSESGNNLVEWAGDTAGIHAICAHLLKSQRNVYATYSPAVDPAADMFWRCGEWCSAPMANLRILNLAALLKSYAPWLEKRVPAGAGVLLKINENSDTAQLGAANGDLIAFDRLKMVRLMFGPIAPSVVAGLPDKLRWLDQVFPLPFLLPPLSHV